MKLRFALVIILLFTSMAQPKRYALLVGNSSGGKQLDKLLYVNNDLQELAQTLSSLCGFKAENIVTLFNETPQNVISALGSLSKNFSSGSDDFFLFYYSGHADQSHLKMGPQRLSLKDLKKQFENFPARIRVAVLDACQSGSVTRIKGGALSEPFLFREDTKVKGQVILYSSSATENSQESDKLKNSIFTFHFLNALRGCGDVSGDKKITLSEAYQYSYNNTVSSTAQSLAGVQHPGYQFKIQGEGDIVLADLSTVTSGIILGSNIQGPITILDKPGNLIADFIKEKGTTPFIALNSGSYQVYNSTEKTKRKSSFSVKNNRVTPIGKQNFSSVKASSALNKGSISRGIVPSLTGTFGADFSDLTTFSAGLENVYSDYSFFNISPKFEHSKYLYRFGFHGEIALRVGVVFRWGGEYVKYDDNGTYYGQKKNTLDGIEYEGTLSTSTDLSMVIFDTGPGFRFKEGLLKDFSIFAGLNSYFLDLNSTSNFKDALFKTESNSSINHDKTIVLPYGALQYEYPLYERLRLGVNIRYRYQDKKRMKETVSVSVNGSSSEPKQIEYRLGGFDIMASVRIPIGPLYE